MRANAFHDPGKDGCYEMGCFIRLLQLRFRRTVINPVAIVGGQGRCFGRGFAIGSFVVLPSEGYNCERYEMLVAEEEADNLLMRCKEK